MPCRRCRLRSPLLRLRVRLLRLLVLRVRLRVRLLRLRVRLLRLLVLRVRLLVRLLVRWRRVVVGGATTGC